MSHFYFFQQLPIAAHCQPHFFPQSWSVLEQIFKVSWIRQHFVTICFSTNTKKKLNIGVSLTAVKKFSGIKWKQGRSEWNICYSCTHALVLPWRDGIRNPTHLPEKSTSHGNWSRHKGCGCSSLKLFSWTSVFSPSVYLVTTVSLFLFFFFLAKIPL